MWLLFRANSLGWLVVGRRNGGRWKSRLQNNIPLGDSAELASLFEIFSSFLVDDISDMEYIVGKMTVNIEYFGVAHESRARRASGVV